MNKSSDRISWWRTDFTEDEVAKVTESIRNEHISMGSVTEAFEQALADALEVPYVVACTNGSSALLMALMALDIQAGDEVIVPNRTWIATAHAPMMLGAKPVLVDVLPNRPILDTGAIRDRITERTRAIMPVQLNGCAVDMEEVWEIAHEYGLFVVEDSSQGLFSKYRGSYMGTRSDAGCFSLSISKLISTGQGGFVVTGDEAVYMKLRSIRTHGVDNVDSGAPFTRMGFNFRFTDLQASIGLVQLGRIKERVARQKEIWEQYRMGMAEIGDPTLIPVHVEEGEVPLHVEVLCKDRERLVAHLSEQDIGTRPLYPDLDTAEHLGDGSDFPNTRKFGKNGLVLPCGPGQSTANIEKVLAVLNSWSGVV